MDEARVRQLLRDLAQVADLGGEIEKLGLSAGEAADALRRGAGRREHRAWLFLARTQAQLMAARWSAIALGQLCRLMTESEKEEVQLRAAAALLAAARENSPRPGSRRPRDKGRSHRLRPLSPAEQGEAVEVMQLVAQELARRRAVEAMGPPPALPASAELTVPEGDGTPTAS